MSEETFVARVGGDEFVAVIEDASTRQDLVKRLAGSIRTRLSLSGTHRVAPLLSVGVAVWAPSDGTDPDLPLREADAAMFEGKRSEVGAVVFDDALRAQMIAEKNLGSEIDTPPSGPRARAASPADRGRKDS